VVALCRGGVGDLVSGGFEEVWRRLE